MTQIKFSILVLGLFALFGLLSFIYGYPEWVRMIWPRIFTDLPFGDITNIVGVNQTIALGLDPMVTNPGNWLNITLNYPRIWQYLAVYLRLDTSSLYYFGFFNIFLYVIGFLIFVSQVRLSRWTVVLLLITFFSPASVLAMERGNIDMVMFFLISLAIRFIFRPVIYTSIVFVAAVLKFYPIAAIIGLIRHPEPVFIRYGLICLVLFICYLGYTLDDLRLIKKATPLGSYGMEIVLHAVVQFMKLNLFWELLIRGIVYFYILFVVVFSVGFVGQKKSLLEVETDSSYIDSFRVGAMVFVATFLLITSWDYRLIFLIFALPQLIDWVRENKHSWVRLPSKLAIVLTVLNMWTCSYSLRNLFDHWWWHKSVFLAEQSLEWLLFTVLFFLLVISLPDWVIRGSKKLILQINKTRIGKGSSIFGE